MKKFAVLVAVVVLAAFAAPALAATNPFMDVPMNHWSYDAIGQLAAHGILSGYPDGTYKGQQPTTRYEMASALARALAVVDMTKASKQDVEMLKKLVVEFKDELEALGVKVDEIDGKVEKLDERLGGWHMHGVMRVDVDNYGSQDEPIQENRVSLPRARLFFERYFGEDESMFFRARLDNENAGSAWQQFFVRMPFFFDSQLTVGKFAWDAESAYYQGGDSGTPNTGGFAGLDSVLTDRNVTGLFIQKQFGLGDVRGYVSHKDNLMMADTGSTLTAWELFGMARLQFTEQVGFDFGGQAFIGDNATSLVEDDAGTNLGSIWTVFAGLRFNFNDAIALKALYYHQKWKGDTWDTTTGWNEWDNDPNHWRVIVDVNQDALKFTSLWLEYGQMDGGFYSPAGLTGQGSMFATSFANGGRSVLLDDMKYWRVVLGQKWNEKWGTHLFYYGYDFDVVEDLTEWGLGVQYTYNPNVTFGLNFVKADWGDYGDDHVVKFRTEVTF